MGIRQRVFGLAYGYKDLNDHDTLRNHIAFQAAVEKDISPWGAAPPGARAAGRPVFSWLLPALLFFAALCLLRRPVPGELLRPSNIDGAKHSWAILALC